MNKITKIGFTALAGSLVATSAFAGAMSVSGSAKVTYQGGKGNSGANPYSNSKVISFSGSGEMDNGFTVSTGYTMTNAAFSSSYVSLDMGDSGTLHFMNGTSKVNKTDGEIATIVGQLFDMRPSAIEARLKLRNPIYTETAAYGHMGRTPEVKTVVFESPYNGKVEKEIETFTWEKLDHVEKVKAAFNL